MWLFGDWLAEIEKSAYNWCYYYLKLLKTWRGWDSGSVAQHIEPMSSRHMALGLIPTSERNPSSEFHVWVNAIQNRISSLRLHVVNHIRLSQKCPPSEFADVCRWHHTFITWDYELYLNLSRNKSPMIYNSTVNRFISCKCSSYPWISHFVHPLSKEVFREETDSSPWQWWRELSFQAQAMILLVLTAVSPPLVSLFWWTFYWSPHFSSADSVLLGVGIAYVSVLWSALAISQQLRWTYPLGYTKEKGNGLEFGKDSSLSLSFIKMSPTFACFPLW